MELTEESVWFFIRNHQQQGPVGLFELHKLMEQGILTENTFVWNKEIDGWQTAKSLQLFPDHHPALVIEKSQENVASTWTAAEKDLYPNGRPFVRYMARLFDLSLFSFFLITFISIFSPQFVFEAPPFLLFIVSLLLYILVETAILFIFGNTLGKFLLNTRIKRTSGERIDLFTAIKRSLMVTSAGMGLGVPILNFICFYLGYRALKKHGHAFWDKQCDTVVLYGQASTGRILFISLFPLILVIAGFVL